MVELRVFPIAPEVPSNTCGTGSINRLKQLSGIAVASQALLNSRHALGPRSVGEDVKNSCPIPEHALGASPDNNAIPFGGSPQNHFLRDCSYRIRIKELHVSRRGASHDRGGPDAGAVYAVPP